MSLAEMQNLWDQSTLVRATCALPVASRPTQDFMVANKADFSSILTEDDGGCLDTIETNLMGDSCSGSVPFYWRTHETEGNWHPVIDVTYNQGCDCTSGDFNEVSSQDFFGQYGTVSTSHLCTASSTSTTEWWFGACVEDGSCASYTD